MITSQTINIEKHYSDSEGVKLYLLQRTLVFISVFAIRVVFSHYPHLRVGKFQETSHKT